MSLRNRRIYLLFVGCAYLALSCDSTSPSATHRSQRTTEDSDVQATPSKLGSKRCPAPKSSLALAGETYEKDARPILTAKCVWCHSPNSSRKQTPYLDTFQGAVNAANNSLRDMNRGSMPPRNQIPPLASTDAGVFSAWINGGMVQGTPFQIPAAGTKVTYQESVQEYLRLNCTGCHSPEGKQAPDLTGYAAAKGLVSASINAMQQNRMPPGLPSESPKGVSLLNRWVSDGTFENMAALNDAAKKPDLTPVESSDNTASDAANDSAQSAAATSGSEKTSSSSSTRCQ